jgi:hypothetical protein
MSKYSRQKIDYYANLALKSGAYLMAYSGKSDKEIRRDIGRNYNFFEDTKFKDSLPTSYARSKVYDKIAERIGEIRSVLYNEEESTTKRQQIFEREQRYGGQYEKIAKDETYKASREVQRVRRETRKMEGFSSVSETYSTNEVQKYGRLITEQGSGFEKFVFVDLNGEAHEFTPDNIHLFRTILSQRYNQAKKSVPAGGSLNVINEVFLNTDKGEIIVKMFDKNS